MGLLTRDYFYQEVMLAAVICAQDKFWDLRLTTRNAARVIANFVTRS